MDEVPSSSGTVEVSYQIGLKHLWELQEQCLSQNVQQSKLLRDALGLLDQSIRLNLSILDGMRFAAEKQTAIRVLAVDALSHVVIAARIGVWGALPESLSVLRGGVESCAQLALTVSKELYGTAFREIKGGRLVRLKFAAACKDLGENGDGFRKHHSRISNVAAHSTSSSLQQEEYRINGEPYDRLASAQHPRSAEIATSECLDLAPLVAVSLCKAYDQDGIAPQEEWLTTLHDGHVLHGALKGQIRSKHQDTGSSDAAPNGNGE
jgi:hypothetical protein